MKFPNPWEQGVFLLFARPLRLTYDSENTIKAMFQTWNISENNTSFCTSQTFQDELRNFTIFRND
jgi:hypothetical protein